MNAPQPVIRSPRKPDTFHLWAAAPETLGALWRESARREGHTCRAPARHQRTAKDRITDLMSDGEWHPVAEICAAADIAPNNMLKYTRKLGLERREVPQRMGRPFVEWRAPR